MCRLAQHFAEQLRQLAVSILCREEGQPSITPRHTSPTTRAWHPGPSLAATPASEGQRSPCHETAVASHPLQSGERRAQHHWQQPHAERLQARGHGLHTRCWHGDVVRSHLFHHPLETRQCSGGVAASATQRRDGDSGTTAVRCPAGRGTGWRVRDIPAFLARSPSGSSKTVSHRGPHRRSRMDVRNKKF